MKAELFRRLSSDPAEFRKELLIDTDDGPRPLADVMDDWQALDFWSLASGWRGVVGQRVDGGGCRRAYLERPRGHSKTADLAAMASWALFASRRQLLGVAAAADQEQAGLLRKAIERLVSLNSWLAEFLEVQKFRVINPHTKSELTILSSDAATSYGLTPDFIIVDELTHWPKEDLWISLFSAAEKRRHCMLVIIANAGTGRGRSWQWKVREEARTDDDWHFHRLDGPVASWIVEGGGLAAQERMLPPMAYARLWLNQWTSGEGDALDEADLRRCVTQPGPLSAEDYHKMSHGGMVAGLDLGATRDHASFLGVAVDYATHHLRLAFVHNWRPNPTIDLEEIYHTIVHARKEYNLRFVAFDPWQALSMAQRLEGEGVHMEQMPSVGQNLNRMACSLLECFRDHRIDLYDDDLLIADLLRLTIVEKPYGFKLEATRDEDGHADRATALALCLPWAMDEASVHRVPDFEVSAGTISQHMAMYDQVEAFRQVA